MRFPLVAALILSSSFVLAQSKAETAPPPPSKPDAFFQQLMETRFFSSGRPGSVSISPDEKTVFFLRNPPDSSTLSLFAFDVATGQTREFLAPAAVLESAAKSLSAEEKARRAAAPTRAAGFSSYALSEDGERFLVSLSGGLYVVQRASGRAQALQAGPDAIDPSLSPDGKQVAYVRGHDLYRLDVTTNTEHRVTRGGTEEKTHGLAELIAREEMFRFSGYWWSPDSKALAYTEADTRDVEKLNLVDALHPEQAARRIPYPRAGTANARVRLGIVPLTGGTTRWVGWDAEKYPYLAQVKWPAKGPLTLLVQNRTQTEGLLLAVDVKTGTTSTLHVEKDAAWHDLDPTFPVWLDDGSGFLWLTERNGGPEVELRDANGGLVRSLLAPEAGFESWVGYEPGEDTLYFAGGPDTPERYVWRARRGEKPLRLTSGGPARETGRMSRRRGLLIVQSESPHDLRRTFVVRADGTRVGELPSVAKEPPLELHMEVRQVGKQGFWTALFRPKDAKPGVKLPVIVDIYAGPGTTSVFQSMAQNLFCQWMADHGFLVVKLDGAGTNPNAGPAARKPKYDFAQVLLEEQVAALRALAAEVPELDLDRVGITGGSHGGYMSALAALVRPDVFKAAVAVSAVTDWRDYDTHLTERLLGLPQEHPEAYEKSSLLTHVKAGQPMGKLLIIHGTADDNVFFFHALKLSDALFRAGQPHEFLPLVGMSHRVFTSEGMWKRTVEFFQQHLHPRNQKP